MHSFLTYVGVMFVMVTSIVAAPMYNYYGPKYGTKREGVRIDPQTFAAYFTPEQIKSIWGSFEFQRERLVDESEKLFPDDDPKARRKHVERQLAIKGGPYEQILRKMQQAFGERDDRSFPDRTRATEAIQEEEEKWAKFKADKEEKKKQDRKKKMKARTRTKSTTTTTTTITTGKAQKGASNSLSMTEGAPGEHDSKRQPSLWHSLGDSFSRYFSPSRQVQPDSSSSSSSRRTTPLVIPPAARGRLKPIGF